MIHGKSLLKWAFSLSMGVSFCILPNLPEEEIAKLCIFLFALPTQCVYNVLCLYVELYPFIGDHVKEKKK